MCGVEIKNIHIKPHSSDSLKMQSNIRYLKSCKKSQKVKK